jgi:tRNA pseudouridine13 synthase
MYKIKQQPEDFIVKEIPLAIATTKPESGPYLYFKLKKRNWNTLDAIKGIAFQLHCKLNKIGFAGSKDRQAVTEQLISIIGRSKEQVLKIKTPGISLEYSHSGKEPFTLGSHAGNKFEIIIRNLDEDNINNNKLEEINKTHYCENYFDEQRFSTNNVNIGRFIVKKKFKQAVELIDQQKVKDYLKLKQNDAIGAMRLLPVRLLRMYVNSYQSYLWNETVKRYLEQFKVVKKIDYSLGELIFISKEDQNKMIDLQIPLIGFDSEKLELKIEPKYELIKTIIKQIMKEEELYYRDFIIKQIPPISLEGELRPVFIEVKAFEISEIENDELNEDKKKVKVSFSLGKGSYATMVIRRVVSEGL